MQKNRLGGETYKKSFRLKERKAKTYFKSFAPKHNYYGRTLKSSPYCVVLKHDAKQKEVKKELKVRIETPIKTRTKAQVKT